MVRFIQATISGGKKVYFNADRISAKITATAAIHTNIQGHVR